AHVPTPFRENDWTSRYPRRPTRVKPLPANDDARAGPARPSFSDRARRLLRQDADDVVQRAADAAGESGEDRDGADRDHCQDDAVLGHRLALLALPVRPHELEPLIECHSTYLLVGFPARRPASPPSPCSPRKERATAWADPSSDSSEASAGL